MIFERHLEGRREETFRQRQRDRRAGGQSFRVGRHIRQEAAVVEHGGREADAVRLFRVEITTGQDDLARARESDQAWEQIAHAGVGAEAATYVARRYARGPRKQPNVGGERQTKTRTGGRSIDRGDERFLTSYARHDPSPDPRE